MGLPGSRPAVAFAGLVALALFASCGGEAAESSSRVTSSLPPSTATTADAGTKETGSPESSVTTAPESTTTTAPVEPPTFESLAGIDTIGDFAGFTDSGLSRWQESIEGLEEIQVTSTSDGEEQPALWLGPDGDGDMPLLVILHSWSSDYVQHAGIPYAMWAQENGWAVIAPQFRGINDDPDALGSDLAVQDVVDAIDHAASQDGVRSDRVFAVGYSGGGMMSLLLAGRHPDKVSAVAAWGPPYDLIAFYRQSVETGRHYVEDIRAGCGGDPTEEGEAQDQCVQRSPMTHLDGAKESGVPVLLGHGIHDSLLSPAQSGWAFNQLADSSDQFSEEQLEQLGQGVVPEDLAGAVDEETFFGEGDPDPVLARSSGPVLIVFFDADHEMVYEASARWFAGDPG